MPKTSNPSCSPQLPSSQRSDRLPTREQIVWRLVSALTSFLDVYKALPRQWRAQQHSQDALCIIAAVEESNEIVSQGVVAALAMTHVNIAKVSAIRKERHRKQEVPISELPVELRLALMIQKKAAEWKEK